MEQTAADRKRISVKASVGLAPGLFLARAIAEATGMPWSPVALVVLVVASCAASVWLAHRLARRATPLPLVPSLVLFVYVVWPQRDWHTALVVAAIALLSWLVGLLSGNAYHTSPITSHISRSTLIDLLTFIIALGIYVATLQKDVLPADSGEFQLTVTTLAGVLHQPGYPLYTLVGKLFTLLPFSTPALRLNLMSALLAAGTLTLVGAAVRRMPPTPALSYSSTTKEGGCSGMWGGLASILALGAATTFWAQATTANIRMPTAFFTAWCLYLLIAYRESLFAFRSSPLADRCLMLFALAFSLGIGHYFPLAFVGLFFVAYLALVDPALIRQPRRWRKPLAIFALAQLVWLYLPIHAAIAPTPETQGLLSPGYLLWYAMGQGFGGDMLAFAGPEHLPSRLALLPTLFSFQMNPALLAAALVGAIWLMRRDWRAGLMLVGGFLLHTFITITYRAPQTVEYEMPAYIVLAVLIGYGVNQISNVRSQISNALVAGVIVAGLANGMSHAPSFFALAGDRSTREYVEPILGGAPASAIILSDWHTATPMWYLQQVEGLRRDVEVRYVFPVPGQEWSQVWRGLIQDNITQRPVIVTHYWGLQYATLPYTFEPFGQAWLVRKAPSFDAPHELMPVSVDFEGKIKLLGYRISPARATPGHPLDVTVAWQTLGQLDRDYSLTVRLVDMNGARRTQRDRGYPTRTFAPGEVRVDRFTLPLEPTLLPGQYAIQLGVYNVPPEGCCRNLTTADGAQLATVTRFELAPADEALPTLHPLEVPFVDGPTLTGVDYDSSGRRLRVYLHWRGPSLHGMTATVLTATSPLPVLPSGATFITSHDIDFLSPPLYMRLADLETGAGGRIGAGVWGWPVEYVRLPDPGDERYVMLSDQMLLTGVESPRRQVMPGQSVDVTLQFLSLKPLVTDNVVSVRIEGADWRVSSDDRPAGNAFPTLKWIAQSLVSDRRRLAVPADATSGRASGHLTVYDAFREDVLPPLDARMGDSVPLGEWDVGPKGTSFILIE